VDGLDTGVVGKGVLIEEKRRRGKGREGSGRVSRGEGKGRKEDSPLQALVRYPRT